MYNFLSRSISKSNCCLSRICKKAPKYAVKKAMSEPFDTIKVPIKKPIEFSKASTSHDGKLLTKKCSYQVMHRSLFPDPPKEVIQIMMFSTSSSEYFYTSTINQDRRKSNNQKAVEVYKQALENVMKIKFQKKRIDDPFMNADYKVKPYRSTSGPDPLERNIAKVQEKLDQPSKSYLPAVRLNKTLMRQSQPKVDWTRKKRPPTLNFEHPHLKQFKIVYPTYKLKNKLAVRDADQDKPQVWNNKMKKVYRVEPPSDRIIVRPYNNKLACTSGNSNENKRVLGDKYSMVVMKRRNKLDQLMRAAHDLQKEALRIRKKMLIGKHPSPVLSYEDKVKESSYRPEEDELYDLEPKENLLRVEKFLGTSLVKSENSNQVLNVQKYIEAPVPAEDLRFNKKSEVETIKLINVPDPLKQEISEQSQPVQDILSYVEKLKRLKEQSSLSKSVLKLPVKGEEKVTEQITVAEHFDEIKKPFYKKVLKKYINVNEILDMPSKDIIKPPENILLSKNTDLPPKQGTSKKSFEDILSKYAKNEPPATKSDTNIAKKVKTLLKPANEYIEKLKEAGENKIKNLETSIDEQIQSIENSLDEMKSHLTGNKSTTANNSPPEKVLTTNSVLSTPVNSKDSNKKIVTLDRKEAKAVTKILEKTKAEEKAKSNDDKYKTKQKPLIEQMRDNIDASIKEDYQKTFGESFKPGEEKTTSNINKILEPNSNLTIKSGAIEKWMLDNKLTVNMKDNSTDESFINTTNKTVQQTPPPTFKPEKKLEPVTQKDKSPSTKLTPTPASHDQLNKEPDHILQKQAMDQYQEESYDNQSREEEDEEFYPKDYKKSKFQSQLDEVPEKWLKKKYNEMKLHQRVSYVDELIRDETPEEKILRKYHDMKMDSTQRNLPSGEAPEDWARRKYKELQASQNTSTESAETPEQWFQRNQDKLKLTTEIKAADDLKAEEKKSETPEEWLRRKYKEFKSKLYGKQKEMEEKQESDEMKAMSADETPDMFLGATYEVNPKEKPEQWALRKLEDYANNPSLLKPKYYKEDEDMEEYKTKSFKDDYDDGKKYKAKYYEDDEIEYKTKSYKDDGDSYKTKSNITSSYYDDDDEGLKKYKTKSYYDDDDEGLNYKTKSYYDDDDEGLNYKTKSIYDDDYNEGNKYQTKSYYSDDDGKHYKTKSYEDDDDYRYETKSFDDDKLYKYDEDDDEVRKYKEIKAASNYETKHDKDYESEYPGEKFMKKVKKTKTEYEEFYVPEKYAAKPYRLESEANQFDSEFVPRDDSSYEEKIKNKYIRDDAPYSEKMKRKYKDMKLKSADDSGEYEEEFIKFDDYKYHPREEETFFETTDKPYKKEYYAKGKYEEKDEEDEEGGKYASELGDLVGDDSRPKEKETYIMKPLDTHEDISNKTPTTSWVSAIENFSKELAAKAGIISLDNKYKEDGRLKKSDVELSSFTEEPLDKMYKSKTEILDEIIRENEQKADFKQVDDDETQVPFDQVSNQDNKVQKTEDKYILGKSEERMDRPSPPPPTPPKKEDEKKKKPPPPRGGMILPPKPDANKPVLKNEDTAKSVAKQLQQTKITMKKGNDLTKLILESDDKLRDNLKFILAFIEELEIKYKDGSDVNLIKLAKDMDNETEAKKLSNVPLNLVRKVMKVKRSRDKRVKKDKHKKYENVIKAITEMEDKEIEKPKLKANHSESSLMQMYLLDEDERIVNDSNKAIKRINKKTVDINEDFRILQNVPVIDKDIKIIKNVPLVHEKVKKNKNVSSINKEIKPIKNTPLINEEIKTTKNVSLVNEDIKPIKNLPSINEEIKTIKNVPLVNEKVINKEIKTVENNPLTNEENKSTPSQDPNKLTSNNFNATLIENKESKLLVDIIKEVEKQSVPQKIIKRIPKRPIKINRNESYLSKEKVIVLVVPKNVIPPKNRKNKYSFNVSKLSSIASLVKKKLKNLRLKTKNSNILKLIYDRSSKKQAEQCKKVVFKRKIIKTKVNTNKTPTKEVKTEDNFLTIASRNLKEIRELMKNVKIVEPKPVNEDISKELTKSEDSNIATHSTIKTSNNVHQRLTDIINQSNLQQQMKPDKEPNFEEAKSTKSSIQDNIGVKPSSENTSGTEPVLSESEPTSIITKPKTDISDKEPSFPDKQQSKSIVQTDHKPDNDTRSIPKVTKSENEVKISSDVKEVKQSKLEDKNSCNDNNKVKMVGVFGTQGPTHLDVKLKVNTEIQSDLPEVFVRKNVVENGINTDVIQSNAIVVKKTDQSDLIQQKSGVIHQKPEQKSGNLPSEIKSHLLDVKSGVIHHKKDNENKNLSGNEIFDSETSKTFLEHVDNPKTGVIYQKTGVLYKKQDRECENIPGNEKFVCELTKKSLEHPENPKSGVIYQKIYQKQDKECKNISGSGNPIKNITDSKNGDIYRKQDLEYENFIPNKKFDSGLTKNPLEYIKDTKILLHNPIDTLSPTILNGINVDKIEKTDNIVKKKNKKLEVTGSLKSTQLPKNCQNTASQYSIQKPKSIKNKNNLYITQSTTSKKSNKSQKVADIILNNIKSYPHTAFTKEIKKDKLPKKEPVVLNFQLPTKPVHSRDSIDIKSKSNKQLAIKKGGNLDKTISKRPKVYCNEDLKKMFNLDNLEPSVRAKHFLLDTEQKTVKIVLDVNSKLQNEPKALLAAKLKHQENVLQRFLKQQNDKIKSIKCLTERIGEAVHLMKYKQKKIDKQNKIKPSKSSVKESEEHHPIKLIYTRSKPLRETGIANSTQTVLSSNNNRNNNNNNNNNKNSNKNIPKPKPSSNKIKKRSAISIKTDSNQKSKITVSLPKRNTPINKAKKRVTYQINKKPNIRRMRRSNMKKPDKNENKKRRLKRRNVILFLLNNLNNEIKKQQNWHSYNKMNEKISPKDKVQKAVNRYRFKTPLDVVNDFDALSSPDLEMEKRKKNKERVNDDFFKNMHKKMMFTTKTITKNDKSEQDPPDSTFDSNDGDDKIVEIKKSTPVRKTSTLPPTKDTTNKKNIKTKEKNTSTTPTKDDSKVLSSWIDPITSGAKKYLLESDISRTILNTIKNSFLSEHFLTRNNLLPVENLSKTILMCDQQKRDFSTQINDDENNTIKSKQNAFIIPSYVAAQSSHSEKEIKIIPSTPKQGLNKYLFPPFVTMLMGKDKNQQTEPLISTKPSTEVDLKKALNKFSTKPKVNKKKWKLKNKKQKEQLQQMKKNKYKEENDTEKAKRLEALKGIVPIANSPFAKQRLTCGIEQLLTPDSRRKRFNLMAAITDEIHKESNELTANLPQDKSSTKTDTYKNFDIRNGEFYSCKDFTKSMNQEPTRMIRSRSAHSSTGRKKPFSSKSKVVNFSVPLKVLRPKGKFIEKDTTTKVKSKSRVNKTPTRAVDIIIPPKTAPQTYFDCKDHETTLNKNISEKILAKPKSNNQHNLKITYVNQNVAQKPSEEYFLPPEKLTKNDDFVSVSTVKLEFLKRLKEEIENLKPDGSGINTDPAKIKTRIIDRLLDKDSGSESYTSTDSITESWSNSCTSQESERNINEKQNSVQNSKEDKNQEDPKKK